MSQFRPVATQPGSGAGNPTVGAGYQFGGSKLIWKFGTTTSGRRSSMASQIEMLFFVDLADQISISGVFEWAFFRTQWMIQAREIGRGLDMERTVLMSQGSGNRS